MSFTPEQLALRDRAAMSATCRDWAAQQGWALRRAGAELVGPCPVCGGRDRFSINLDKDVWNCRGCSVGGDVIFLVMHTENLRFLDACARIVGEGAPGAVSAAEQARLAEARAAQQREQEAQAAHYREKARREARQIWVAAQRIVGSAPEAGPEIARYFRQRGLDGGRLRLADPDWAQALGLPLRLAPRRAYWHEREVIHTGPAMIAAIQMPDGRFGGVHQTWLDPAAPKGKLVLADAAGAALPAKKVLGTKKGGAIRLHTPSAADGTPAAWRLVMGEGIETTLTALAHAHEPETAYWAGVDLGNMSGKAARDGEGRMVHDQPDMADRACFLPPDWCRELVYLCDSDEPEKHTVDKVTRGLRRALRLRELARREQPALPPLTIKMVPPGAAGTDLNSLVMDDR